MPYVSVPRDLSKVKTKIVAGLTKRQLICLASAVVVSIPIWLVSMKILGELAIFPVAVFAAPFILLGFSKRRDNRPLEQVILNYLRVRFQLPRVRPYMTENTYKRLELLSKIEEEVKNASKNSTNKQSADEEN